MSYKDLLVHVDASRHCRARLELAAALARRFAAQLRGMYVLPPVTLSPFMVDQFQPARLEEADAEVGQERDVAKALFETAIAGLKPAAEWLEGEGDAAELVSREGRHTDLAILGQTDPDERLSGRSPDFAESVAMGTGRPVLMVPYAGRFATLGENVLVAWNGSPQASRAVRDALPFLAGAKRVEILSIIPRPAETGAEPGEGEAICRYLARHGIAAETHELAGGDITVGDMLLSRAADEGVDLIVMGVYGHSRLRELVLGGASRQIFERMTVPVLMAH